MIFGTNFERKVYFQSKTEKNKHHYWILLIRISLSSNFQLKLTIAIFWTKSAKKGSYFQSDKIDTRHWILHIGISLYQISFWANYFEFLDQICPRKMLMVKKRKIEHHHWIPVIQISLGTKFQLKENFDFFDQIYPKRVFLV